jgi:DNA-binding transcriptional LysR family regulator
MERRQLEYFLAVIDHGGFTSAAAALHVSQPALSAAIKSLEKELGALLFHRLPRGVRVTEAGAELAQSARMIMRELDTARARVDAVTGLVAGRLDIISLPGILLDPLAPVIGHFRRRHPRVRVRVVQAEAAEDVRDAVRAGDAELGLTDEAEATARDVVAEPILEQELVAVLPPGIPLPPAGVLTVQNLLRMNVITGPPGTPIRDLLTREGTRLGLEVSPAVEVTPRGSALYLVLAGAGIAILPRPVALLGGARGAGIVSLQPRQTRLVYLLRRDAPLSPAADAFHTLLRRELGAPSPARLPELPPGRPRNQGEDGEQAVGEKRAP